MSSYSRRLLVLDLVDVTVLVFGDDELDVDAIARHTRQTRSSTQNTTCLVCWHESETTLETTNHKAKINNCLSRQLIAKAPVLFVCVLTPPDYPDISCYNSYSLVESCPYPSFIKNTLTRINNHKFRLLESLSLSAKKQ